MDSAWSALWDVVRVALVTMMCVNIFGVYYDALFNEPKIELVPCSVTINNMARNLNVTLLDMCELER